MSIFLFFIILVALIVVHEFGHFIVAKKSGIRVDEFGIGFPPRALTLFKKGETTYTLNWLPFGGFVKIFGEDPDSESLDGPDKERSLVHKPKIIQIFVLAAGVLFNVLIAWLIFIAVFLIGTPTLITEEERARVSNAQFQIVHVLPDSPAEAAGVSIGDTILAVTSGSQAVRELTTENVTDFISTRGNQTVTFELLRDGAKRTVDLVPAAGLLGEDLTRPAVGVGMGFVGTLRLSPLEALREATLLTGDMLVAVTIALFDLFTSAFTLSADLSQITGPVGIVGLVGDAAAVGVTSLLTFAAFISLNLAVINLIPIPALDGGRILFVLIEAIKGSPIQPRVANGLNTAGFALLILLMLAVTYNDIARLIG